MELEGCGRWRWNAQRWEHYVCACGLWSTTCGSTYTGIIHASIRACRHYAYKIANGDCSACVSVYQAVCHHRCSALSGTLELNFRGQRIVLFVENEVCLLDYFKWLLKLLHPIRGGKQHQGLGPWDDIYSTYKPHLLQSRFLQKAHYCAVAMQWSAQIAGEE